MTGAAAELDVAGMVAELKQKKWEVFAKPFEQPAAVYEYLSRYVHQVALSNYRLLALEDGFVSFEYYPQDYQFAKTGSEPKRAARGKRKCCD